MIADDVKAEMKEGILANLENGCSRSGACDAVGISRGTFYNWIAEDEVFRLDVERVRRNAIKVIEDVAFACALKAEKNPQYQTSLIFWLKANAGWKEIIEVENVSTEKETRESILSRINGILAGGGKEKDSE